MPNLRAIIVRKHVHRIGAGERDRVPHCAEFILHTPGYRSSLAFGLILIKKGRCQKVLGQLQQQRGNEDIMDYTGLHTECRSLSIS